jgi:hypothetical protein
VKSPRVTRGLPSAKLRACVPARYRPQLAGGTLKGSNNFTLIVFDHDREDVVLSPVVRRAVERIPLEDSSKLVAVAGCFTLEALEVLAARSAIVLELSSYGWTDDSIKAIRQPQR